MLHCAASQGRYELVDFLLEKCFKDNVNDKNYLGETALHLAAAYFNKGIHSSYGHICLKY